MAGFSCTQFVNLSRRFWFQLIDQCCIVFCDTNDLPRFLFTVFCHLIYRKHFKTIKTYKLMLFCTVFDPKFSGYNTNRLLMDVNGKRSCLNIIFYILYIGRTTRQLHKRIKEHHPVGLIRGTISTIKLI